MFIRGYNLIKDPFYSAGDYAKEFRKKHPDVKRNSILEEKICKLIKRGFNPDTAYNKECC